MSRAYETLAARVDAVVADLDEIQFDMLREAAATGSGRPADDKRLMQVRRALEKASRLLRGSESSDD